MFFILFKEIPLLYESGHYPMATVTVVRMQHDNMAVVQWEVSLLIFHKEANNDRICAEQVTTVENY